MQTQNALNEKEQKENDSYVICPITKRTLPKQTIQLLNTINELNIYILKSKDQARRSPMNDNQLA